MKKNTSLIVLSIFSVLLFFSCSNFALPSKVKVKAEPTINLPFGGYELKISDYFNIEDALTGSGTGDGEDETIVKNYIKKGDKEEDKVQAYLLYYPLVNVPLGLEKRLKEINSDTKLDSINQSFEVPRIGTPVGNVEVYLTTGGGTTSFYPELSSGFINGLVQSGSFTISGNLPSGVVLTVSQDNQVLVKDNYGYGALRTYPGLPQTSSFPLDLAGKHINQNPIKITCSGGLRGRYTLTVRLDVKHFTELHLDINKTTFNQNPAPIHFDLGNMTTWIESAFFNLRDFTDGVGVSINFSAVPSDDMKMTLTSWVFAPMDASAPGERFHDPVVTGKDTDFVNETPGYEFSPQDPKFANGLDFNIAIQLPADDSSLPNVVTLKDVSPGGPPLRLEGTAEIIFDWSDALVKPEDSNENSFPVKGLANIGETLNGMQFKKINGYLYASGPDTEISKLRLLAEYADASNLFPLYDKAIPVRDEPVSISFLTEETSFKEEDLPEGYGEVDLTEVFNDYPSDLFFTYDMKMEAIHLERENENDDTAFKVELYIEMPLAFIVDEGGKEIKIDNLFSGSGDIFGREYPDDPVFGSTGIEGLKSLELSIDLVNGTGLKAGKFKLYNTTTNQDEEEDEGDVLLDLAETDTKKWPLDTSKMKGVLYTPGLKLRVEPGDIQFDRDCYIMINTLGVTAGLEFEMDL